MIEHIKWLGHGSFVIESTPLIYINPWRVSQSAFHADVILVGHDHYEHCSVADIRKLRASHTQIISNERVATLMEGVRVLRPWQSISIDRASIKAIPAYSPEHPKHPPEDGGLGFVISMHYHDIYYVGDSQLIPEMRVLRPDILILPIDDNGTLSIDAAVQLVDQMRPRWAIPCNWGASDVGASALEAQSFKERVGNRSEVIIPSTKRSV